MIEVNDGLSIYIVLNSLKFICFGQSWPPAGKSIFFENGNCGSTELQLVGTESEVVSLSEEEMSVSVASFAKARSSVNCDKKLRVREEIYFLQSVTRLQWF